MTLPEYHAKKSVTLTTPPHPPSTPLVNTHHMRFKCFMSSLCVLLVHCSSNASNSFYIFGVYSLEWAHHCCCGVLQVMNEATLFLSQLDDDDKHPKKKSHKMAEPTSVGFLVSS